jgi:TonB family protein
MRHIIAASLLLTPMLCTAAAVASTPPTDAFASTKPLRVSTGVIPPRIIRSTHIALSKVPERIPTDSVVVLQLKVDEQGVPEAIQVVRPVNPELGAKVAEAVQNFRFSPATLDNQAVPINLTLKVLVQQ